MRMKLFLMEIKGPSPVWLEGNAAVGSSPLRPPSCPPYRTPEASCRMNIPVIDTHQKPTDCMNLSNVCGMSMNYRSTFIVLYRQTDFLPDMDHVSHEFIHHLFGVMRRRWDAHFLRATGNCWVVDGLQFLKILWGRSFSIKLHCQMSNYLDVVIEFTQQDVRQLCWSYRITDLSWKQHDCIDRKWINLDWMSKLTKTGMMCEGVCSTEIPASSSFRRK